MSLCAVVGCDRPGMPQICPHDNKYHHHGRIHYDSPPEGILEFRQDAWHYICDEHYAFVCEARRRWEREVDELRAMNA